MASSLIACDNCGHENPADSIYCEECGVELVVAEPEPAPAPTPEPIPAPPPEPEPAPVAAAPPPEPFPPPQSESAPPSPEIPEPVASAPPEPSTPPQETPVSPVIAAMNDPHPVSTATILDMPDDEPEEIVPEPEPEPEPVIPEAALVHMETGQRFELPAESTIYIGKPNEEIPIQIDLSNLPESDIISRVHAVLHQEGDEYFLEDAGSMNGTSLNQESLRPGTRFRKKIASGDTITFGRKRQVSFRFEVETVS